MNWPSLVTLIVYLHLCSPHPAINFVTAIGDYIQHGWETTKQFAKCPMQDCCNAHWIPNNFTKMEQLLKEEVFGQHIAADVVYKTVKGFISNPSPSKPLVLSFHGWTGNGKNHMAYLIARSLYRNEVNTVHYHHFMATVHFPHSEDSKVYQDQVRTWVKGNVTNCPQSLFVFDEVDKMPAGVLDGIRAYLDYIDRVDGVDYRRAIFIFLSNTGGKEITKKVHDVWLKGEMKREELTVRDFERLVELGAFNEGGGGLKNSHLIEKNLIDVFVPFLPMEKRHVRLCADKEFKKQRLVPKHREAALQTVVDSLNYYPEDTGLYSTTGCKRVAQRVAVYVATERFHRDFDDEL